MNVLTYWMGGYAIAFGVFMLILAFRLRSRFIGTGTPGGPYGPARRARPDESAPQPEGQDQHEHPEGDGVAAHPVTSSPPGPW
jgi:hypothetical protein